MADCGPVHGRACRTRHCDCPCHDGRGLSPLRDAILFFVIVLFLFGGLAAWAWYAGSHGMHR